MRTKKKQLASAALAFVWLFATAAGAQNCAQLVSAQGSVEIQRAGRPDWSPAAVDAQVCEGDRLRVGGLSRAALLVGPGALIRVEENTALGLRVTAEATEVEMQTGAVYSISRFPRRYRIHTPFVNAGVEGTEFLVALRRDEAQVAVYEGHVGAEDLIGGRGATRRLASGELARFARGAAPAVAPMARPADAVQWALYYPPLDAQAIGAALHELPDCERTAAPERARCFTRRSARLLRLGRVERAERDIESALALVPEDSDATALTALVRVVKNERGAALELARRAVARDGRSVPALIALSYAEQAHFRLDAALEAASRAVEAEPANSVAHSRRAELLLSVGRIDDAQSAANAAVQANPADSRARTVLGFAQLARLDTRAARAQLSEAAGLDPSDPLPRLGLGLAAIKDGRLAAGRGEIEIAVALDPQNALLRSYLGKAYSDELRDGLAEIQLARARQLDPNDPTAFYYNAIRLQALNRPGEALRELQESIARNDNRAVYRSRLLLDQDQAARSASLAYVYSDLGFDQLAISEGMRALNTDPRNFAAHRFVADAYLALPRFEVARVSELLQSQMLQPAASALLSPRLGETRIPVPQTAGPTTPSFHDLNLLLARDGHLFALGGVAGEQDTIGDEALYAYRRGSRTVQFGQVYFETDGYRQNADLRQKSYNFFYQDDITAATSWQLEGRTTRLESGDVKLQFEPASFSPTTRNRLDTESVRLGLRHSRAPGSTWLFSLIASERVENQATHTAFDAPPLTVDFTDRFQGRAETAELQYLGTGRLLDLVAGAGFVQQRESRQPVVVITLPPLPPFSPPGTSSRPHSHHGNVYGYGLWHGPGGSVITTGLAIDDYDNELRFSQRRYSPKFGVVAPMAGGTTLRAAAFRSVKRLITTNQTLEPTQVAGFNQLFDDVDETRSERLGIAIDQRFSRALFAGVELTRRELETQVANADGTFARWDRVHEQLHRAYASWLVRPHLSAGIEYVYDHRDREFPPGASDVVVPARVTSQYAPFTLAYHHPAGPFASFRAGYVSQKVKFARPGGVQVEGEDGFWIADASLGTRLPRRLGSISLDVLNLFDEQFQYQDTDILGTPRVPQFQPKRLVLLRIRINL